MKVAKPSLSLRVPAGRWIKTLEGYRAFHPQPLPPEISWTPRLVRSLSHADRLLGRLAGEGRRLPNPVGSKNSCGLTVIEFEEAAEAFAGLDLTGGTADPVCCCRE